MALAARAAVAAEADESAVQLTASPKLQPAPGGEAARALPIILRAREVRGRPDLEAVAEGEAEFRRGNTVIRADLLSYDQAEDLAVARGNVRISRDGSVYTGPELQLRVQRFEGFFVSPSYHFARNGAGGTAARFDFLDDQRSVATGATYTSCPLDGSGGPAWLLTTDSVQLDFEANEGIARGAVLRFYGVPILAAPTLSFPLTEARKSGWLPPSINLDSKSGLQVSVPYYWNIAPQRDATISPMVSLKRGLGVQTEFRYLEPRYQGEIRLHLLPDDRLVKRSRYALEHQHDAELGAKTTLQWRTLRASDDAYWKDFPRELNSLTPRLLATDLQLKRPLDRDWWAYARVQQWQVLQDTDPASRLEAPYERVPQIGVRTAQRLRAGLDAALEIEANRFENPTNGTAAERPTGARLHLLASVTRPTPLFGGVVTPRLAINAATYALDKPLAGLDARSRVVPTFSLNAAWLLERDAVWFGREVQQTLEPRLLFVRTPFRAQDTRLNFDSAPNDFNFDSIFLENAFSGVDRVADAHQLTAGLTTRLLNPQTGAESARLSVVQRYLFRDQLVTPELTDDAVPRFLPFQQRFSDVLLLGSSSLVAKWKLDASIQYNPDSKRVVRSIASARFSPEPYRTLNATYRLARGLSEQLEIGWQWPIYGRTPAEPAPATAGTRDCAGSWYTVGRFNYSTRDRRITDSVLGVEHDAGCWIGRIVAERLSTGRSEATTRLLLQLELVGLSRLGSDPLKVLKDNISGYRLLREDRAPVTAPTFHD